MLGSPTIFFLRQASPQLLEPPLLKHLCSSDYLQNKVWALALASRCSHRWLPIRLPQAYLNPQRSLTPQLDAWYSQGPKLSLFSPASPTLLLKFLPRGPSFLYSLSVKSPPTTQDDLSSPTSFQISPKENNDFFLWNHRATRFRCEKHEQPTNYFEIFGFIGFISFSYNLFAGGEIKARDGRVTFPKLHS